MSKIICHAPGDTCLGCKAYRSGEGVCEFAPKPEPHPQADLLEKLDMIKEAVKRNPDGWWGEFTYQYDADGVVFEPEEAPGLLRVIASGAIIRLKPQRVKVEGEVDAELIAEARLVAGHYEGDPAATVAQALLDCVHDQP